VPSLPRAVKQTADPVHTSTVSAVQTSAEAQASVATATAAARASGVRVALQAIAAIGGH
jgi:hypothetical protein